MLYLFLNEIFSFIGYRVRNQLAALDFNHHRGRAIATTADGKPRYVLNL